MNSAWKSLVLNSEFLNKLVKILFIIRSFLHGVVEWHLLKCVPFLCGISPWYFGVIYALVLNALVMKVGVIISSWTIFRGSWMSGELLNVMNLRFLVYASRMHCKLASPCVIFILLGNFFRILSQINVLPSRLLSPGL